MKMIMGATRRDVSDLLSSYVYFVKEIKGSYKGSHLLVIIY
jgi:hypothetical protein